MDILECIVASVRTVLDVTNVVIPIEMTLPPFWNEIYSTSCPKMSAGRGQGAPSKMFDNFLLFFTVDRATRTYTYVTYALVQAR